MLAQSPEQVRVQEDPYNSIRRSNHATNSTEKDTFQQPWSERSVRSISKTLKSNYEPVINELSFQFRARIPRIISKGDGSKRGFQRV
jgi:hypothetical protein